MMWIIPAATAAVGAYQGNEKRKQSERDAKAQAEVARWSPWTGMSPQHIAQNDSALGGAFQGAVGGMSLGQSVDAANAPSGSSGSLARKIVSIGGKLNRSSRAYLSQSQPPAYEAPLGGKYGDAQYSLDGENAGPKYSLYGKTRQS